MEDDFWWKGKKLNIYIFFFSFEVLFSSESCLKIYQVQVKLVIDSDSRLNMNELSIECVYEEKKIKNEEEIFFFIRKLIFEKIEFKNLSITFSPTSGILFYIFPITNQ